MADTAESMSQGKRKYVAFEIGQEVEAMCSHSRFGRGYWGAVIVDKIETETQASDCFVIKWDQGVPPIRSIRWACACASCNASDAQWVQKTDTPQNITDPQVDLVKRASELRPRRTINWLNTGSTRLGMSIEHQRLLKERMLCTWQGFICRKPCYQFIVRTCMQEDELGAPFSEKTETWRDLVMALW